jgi:hypothetical protein
MILVYYHAKTQRRKGYFVFSLGDVRTHILIISNYLNLIPYYLL